MSKEITQKILKDVLALAEKLQTEGPVAVKDEAISIKSQIRECFDVKPAATRGTGCNACGSCAVCLADGPVPDAEVAALGFLINLG